MKIAKFDCLCEAPNTVHYLTIDGETVKEIIKGVTLIDNPKAKPKVKSKNTPNVITS